MNEELDNNLLEKFFEESAINITDEYADGQVVIRIGDSPIGTLGNFSASIGKAKSKKTFNVSAIVAAALSGREILNYTVQLPEDKPNILYIDTEQSQGDCWKVLDRIHRMACISTKANSQRFWFRSLRRFTPTQRIAIIEYALKKIPGLGLVIIDGVRDLLYDINSPTEATQVTTLLMRWTDEYQLHIHGIIHQNKGDDNARGHIGTEINNKAETVLQVEKDKSDGNISKVEAVHCRAKEFEPFAFRIDERVLPALVEGYVFNAPKETTREKFDPFKDIAKEQHMTALHEIFDGIGATGLSRSQLEKRVKEVYSRVFEPIGNNKVTQIITFLSNKRLIVHAVDGNQCSPWILNPLGKY